jgi:hypothetical protein
MKLGFLNLAKKVKLGWIAQAASDHELFGYGPWKLGNLDCSWFVWTRP